MRTLNEVVSQGVDDMLGLEVFNRGADARVLTRFRDSLATGVNALNAGKSVKLPIHKINTAQRQLLTMITAKGLLTHPELSESGKQGILEVLRAPVAKALEKARAGKNQAAKLLSGLLGGSVPELGAAAALPAPAAVAASAAAPAVAGRVAGPLGAGAAALLAAAEPSARAAAVGAGVGGGAPPPGTPAGTPSVPQPPDNIELPSRPPPPGRIDKLKRVGRTALKFGAPALLIDLLVKRFGTFLRTEPGQDPALRDPQALLNTKLAEEGRQRELFNLMLQNPDLLKQMQTQAQPAQPRSPVRSVPFGAPSGDPTEFGG